MKVATTGAVSRRALIASAGAALLAPSISISSGFAASQREYRLVAGPSEARLAGGAYPATEVWAYNDRVPGPEIRVRQGERLRVVVENNLQEETTVHWHGLRVPNAMDGVPHLTQKPIGSGASHVYEFDIHDAGTFWYHPHQRSAVQVGRGLYGPLIVEESNPIEVDRDVVWVLDDWRLTRSAEISGDFGSMHDASHGGRVGNTVTINGQIPDTFEVKGGERIRFRLINAANARIFSLDFTGHQPIIIALDGQPVAPHSPDGGKIVLGPAMRVDLILNMTGAVGARATVVDGFYRGLEYRVVDLVYADVPLRENALESPINLAPNPLAEPDLREALRHEVVFNGGMMGGMMMGGMRQGMSSMREMMHSGKIWFINGIAATGHVMEPMLTLERDRAHVINMKNDTAWHHPIHLHGHSFRVLSRDGKATRYREWQDTVLMAPRDQVEIAFVADNPGDWMFHCHILEHQAAGMMGVIRVGDGRTKA